MTYLIFLVEQLQLVVDKTVFGALFLPQRAFLLQLRTPKGLDAVHARAELLIRQFKFFFEVPQLPLQIGILRLQLSKEEGGWLAAIVLIFRVVGRRGCVGAVVVALQGLVSHGAGPRAVVRPGRGAPPPLLGRRRGLVLARQVRAAARGAAVLRQARARAARAGAPLPAAPLGLPPVLIGRVLPEIQLGSGPPHSRHIAPDSATAARPLSAPRRPIDPRPRACANRLQLD